MRMPHVHRAPILLADERGSKRYRLLVHAAARDVAGMAFPITLHNLSKTGMLFEVGGSLTPGAEIAFDIPGVGSSIARLIWAIGGFYGAEFAAPLTPEQLRTALAKSKVAWPEFALNGAPESRADRQDLHATKDAQTEGQPVCYRFATAAKRGPCRPNEADALIDALRGGCAYWEAGEVKLLPFARMEQASTFDCPYC
jgi:hypothetical protein